MLGNLTSQTDARTCVTTITYDDLNRPTGKSYSGPGACDPTSDVTYSYDSITSGNEGLGRRTGMTDGSGSTAWVYNVLGQVTNETHTVEATNYQLLSTYDAFGRPLTQTLPSGEALTYSYNAMGALLSLSNGTTSYVSQIHYRPSGQVKDMLLGNNLYQQFCHEANTLRLYKLRVYPGPLQNCGAAAANPRLNLTYSYQNNGNVRQIVDGTRSETLNFTYDELDRLDTVSGPYSQNYDYNAIGNITNKNTTTYTYGAAAHKHAVTALSTGESYTYDANGNMTQRVEGGLTYTQTFDAENRLVSVTVSGQTTTFVYDGDGSLVKKLKPDGSRTLYVGGIYEVDKNSGGTVTGTKTYYPAAGAMRIGSTLYYVLKDHLGSASVVTNSTGTIVGEDRFYPFGGTRFTTGTMFTDKLFTGQREVTGLGIYHFGARFYSPYINRFLSADTIIPDYANPQSLNRYAYVLNNPIRYNDPTGHCVQDDKGKCKGWKYSKEYKISTWKQRIKNEFGITTVKDKVAWSEDNLATAYKALNTINNKLNGHLKTMVGGTTFTMTDGGNDYFGRTYPTGIVFHVSASNIDIPLINFYHETGHLLNSVSATDNVFSNQIPKNPTWIKDGYVNSDLLLGKLTEPVQAKYIENEDYLPTEYWADAFANYVAGNIDLQEFTGAGQDMYDFVSGALAPYINP